MSEEHIHKLNKNLGSLRFEERGTQKHSMIVAQN